MFQMSTAIMMREIFTIRGWVGLIALIGRTKSTVMPRVKMNKLYFMT